MNATLQSPGSAAANVARESSAKRILLLILRVAVSCCLLGLAFRHVNWRLFLASLRHLDGTWIGVAFLCLIIQLVLAGLRWQPIVVASGIPLSALTAIRYSFMAAFFNQTLPASVGGDVARIWLLGRWHGNWKAPLYSIVIDRCVGGIAIALLVLACLPLAFNLMLDKTARFVLLFAGLGCLLTFTTVLTIGALPWAWIDNWKASRQARAVTRISGELFLSSWTGAIILFASVVIHLFSALAVWCIAKGLSTPLDLLSALVLVPPVMLLAMLPISIAGWGLRESAMMVALSFARVESSAGLIISVLFGAAGVLIGVMGGVLWIFRGKSAQPCMSQFGS